MQILLLNARATACLHRGHGTPVWDFPHPPWQQSAQIQTPHFPGDNLHGFVDAIDQLVQQSRVRKGVFLSRKAAVDACKDSWKSPHFTSARVLRMIRLSSLSTFIAILITRKNLLFVCGALVFVAASDESFVLCGVKKNCHQAAACHSVLR